MTECPDSTAYRELRFLISKSLDGSISREDVSRMEGILASSASMRAYYCEYMSLHCALESVLESHSAELHDVGGVHDRGLWNAMAHYEKIAPKCVTTALDAGPTAELIRHVEKPRVVRQLSTFSLVSLVTSVAAIVFLVIFARFAPVRSGIEVATVIDAIDAAYAGNRAIPIGARLTGRQESVWLQSGIVKIAFDYGAEVVIEGPAGFTLNTADDMTLHSGRLFAYVPGGSEGFRVDTPSARVIDLGTKFAVNVDPGGYSDVHLFDGSVSLISGPKGQAGKGLILTAGQARRAHGSGLMEEIAVKKTAFVRQINSQTGLVWRGQRALDLADIVGGGNGFGTGTLDSGINTNTGRRFESPDPELVNSKVTGIFTGGGSYNTVSSHAFIDGVFVPDSRQGPVQITSAGYTFDGFVDGREVFWGNIFNGAWHASDQTLKHQLKLNGRIYGTPDSPAISLHSNQGITFDLQAIGQSIPGGKVVRFTSLFGVSETVGLVPSFAPEADGLNSGKVNCWVLIDGQLRFNRNAVSYLHGAIEIDVDIRDDDQFLTLVVTESDDRRAYDWALFAMPSLLIETDTD